MDWDSSLKNVKNQSFEHYDKLLLEAYRADEKEFSRKVAVEIWKRALENIGFANQLKEHYDRIVYNMGFFPKNNDFKSIAIIGYISGLIGEWDPESAKTGIPGSEEAIINMARELVDLGWNVYVYANPPKKSIWSLPVSNPHYIPIGDICDDQHDVIILWRIQDFQFGLRHGKKVYFWPHDLPTVPFTDSLTKINGCIFLSEFQRNEYIKFESKFKEIPYIVSGNGIQIEQFENPLNRRINPYSCVYISNYARGLEILLDIWPSIKKEFPKTQLGIYYGRETWGSANASRIAKIVDKIEKLKKRGVTEHGKVGHGKLAEVLLKSSILAYPCNTTAETYCISAVKAQAAGCIPIITRIGALRETVHPDAPSVDSISTLEEIEEYKKLFIETLNKIKNSEDDLEADRKKYIDFASSKTWKNCTIQWHSFL